MTKKERETFAKIRDILLKEADTIQKLATKQHKEFLGGKKFRSEIFEKYQDNHIKIVKALADNLEIVDIKKGTKIFKKLGETLAKDSVKDGLHIEEAVDGTIFLKQAVWLILDEQNLLDTFTAREFYQISQAIGTYCDIVASKIAFVYHAEYVKSIEKERRKGEQESNKLAAIVTSSDDAIISNTLKGIITSWNRGAQRIFGYKAHEAIGQHISLIIPPDLKKEEEIIISKIKKGESLDHFDTVRIAKDGRRIAVSLTVSPLKTPEGKVIGASKIARDITERKQAEEALEESERRFKALLNATAQAFYRMSADWSEMIQLQGGKFLKATEKPNPHWLKVYIHPDDQKKVMEVVREAVKTGNVFECEHRILQKDGKFGWTWSHAVPLRDNTGKITEWFGAATDITHRKQLEGQKDDFISIASHELKTPVTSVKAYAQVLQYRFKKVEDMKSAELVGKMDAQLNKLTALIGDLLDVTKIESGRLQFHESFFDFNELVTEIIEELQRTTENHTLVKELAPTRTVYGDKDRIGQVLINLITNAIKYSPQADKVIIRTETDKEHITLCVEDFGIGIPPEEQRKVFERFFRVGEPGQETYPGLGLGLYIAAQIIKRQNGKIWVESEREKGSTFCFCLPIQKQEIKQQKNTLVKEEMKHA